jgi:hypothetical protein
MFKEEQTFGERFFSAVELGDKRRTARLIALADQMSQRPGGSLPEKFVQQKDLKAMYRLFDREEVTHEALMSPCRNHLFNEVLPERDGYTLVIHDTTELEYTKRESLSELGSIGNGWRRGFLAHHSLLVCPETGRVLGLANQILHCRPRKRKQQTRAQRTASASRESRLWCRGASVLPSSRKLVDVCDRGADTAEFLQFEANSGRTFLIRSKNNRNCRVGHNLGAVAEVKLHDHLRSLSPEGTWELQVTQRSELKSPSRKGKKRKVVRQQRTATMGCSVAAVELKLSRSRTVPPLQIWGLRVWELNPPPGQEQLEWFLLTNHPMQSFADIWQVVGWYERRWIIEEYHKCLKTGMNIEDYQFTSEERLEPAICLTSIVAVTLLNLRDASRERATENRPATDYIEAEYVEVLSSWRHGKPQMDWTVRQFVWALAKLAGHLNRKGDHPPGWQKLWKGWREFQAMMIGARIAKRKRCG